MGQVEFKTHTQILSRMRNRVVARSDLTDLLPSSSLYKVLDAASREDEDQYFNMRKVLDQVDIDKLYGRDLDDFAKILNPNMISRNVGVKASGSSLVFSRASTVGTKVVPVGQRVKTPDGTYVFVTTEEATISAGNNDSSPVAFQAVAVGTDYNLAINTITAFDSKPSGVDSVTNTAAITNGQDYETDESFRSNIRLYLQSLARATVKTLISKVLNTTVNGKTVVYAEIVEDAVTPGKSILYIDDGSGTVEETSTATGQTVLASAQGGETDLYLTNWPVKIESGYTIYKNATPLVEGTDYSINPSNGQIHFYTALVALDAITADYTYFTGLIAEVQKIIDGDSGDRANYPGYRAAGCWVRVLSPSIAQQAFVANITVLNGYDAGDVASNVTSVVSAYYNSRTIGEDIIYSDLVKRCMNVSGMYDIEITTPSSNVTILSNQLARILTGNIAIS